MRVFILILFVFTFSLIFADLSDGLVAHYPFNGNANDESGNGLYANVYGAVPCMDRFNNTSSAYQFDGTDDFIENAIGLINITDQFTVSFWIFKYGTFEDDYQKMILSGDGPENYGINFSQGEVVTPFYFEISNNTSLITTDYPTADEWHHIVGIYDGSIVEFFIDKFSKGINTCTGNVSPLAPFRIGWGYRNEYFAGKIDDVRIYNRALSESEINELYHQGDWPFLADFSADTQFGNTSLEVNFTDLSENSTNWEWDFQNDGIYDSFIENPAFTYTTPGIYDVKLKATFGTIVESLIKTNYIVVQASQLNAPQNPIITKNGNDIVLNWDAVPNADYYLIYKSNDPYNDFEYLDYTTAVTSYTHSDVISQENKQFYIIIGFDGTMKRLTEFIEQNQRKKFNLDSKYNK